MNLNSKVMLKILKDVPVQQSVDISKKNSSNQEMVFQPEYDTSQAIREEEERINEKLREKSVQNLFRIGNRVPGKAQAEGRREKTAGRILIISIKRKVGTKS